MLPGTLFIFSGMRFWPRFRVAAMQLPLWPIPARAYISILM